MTDRMRVTDGINTCANDLWGKVGLRCDGYEAAMASNVYRDFLRETGGEAVTVFASDHGTVTVVHDPSLWMDTLILRPAPELYTHD